MSAIKTGKQKFVDRYSVIMLVVCQDLPANTLRVVQRVANIEPDHIDSFKIFSSLLCQHVLDPSYSSSGHESILINYYFVCSQYLQITISKAFGVQGWWLTYFCHIVLSILCCAVDQIGYNCVCLVSCLIWVWFLLLIIQIVYRALSSRC